MPAIRDPSEFSVHCPMCCRFQHVGGRKRLVGIGHDVLDSAHHDHEHSVM